MLYSSVCPSCGNRSVKEEQICPECGAVKAEIYTRVNGYESLINYLSGKLTFLDNPEIFVRLVLRLAILLLGGLLLPAFIKQSEFVWMLLMVYTVFGVVKEIEFRIERIRGLYTASKIMLAVYLGAGIGNYISYAGRNYYYHFGYYFNIKFLWEELIRQNGMLLVGAFGGLGILFITWFIKSQFEEKD